MNIHTPISDNSADLNAMRGELSRRLAEGVGTPIDNDALKAKRDRAAQIHFDLEHPIRHLRRAAQLVAMSKEAWESALGPDPAGTLGLALDFLIDSVEEVVEAYLDEDDDGATA